MQVCVTPLHGSGSWPTLAGGCGGGGWRVCGGGGWRGGGGAGEWREETGAEIGAMREAAGANFRFRLSPLNCLTPSLLPASSSILDQMDLTW